MHKIHNKLKTGNSLPVYGFLVTITSLQKWSKNKNKNSYAMLCLHRCICLISKPGKNFLWKKLKSSSNDSKLNINIVSYST